MGKVMEKVKRSKKLEGRTKKETIGVPTVRRICATVILVGFLLVTVVQPVYAYGWGDDWEWNKCPTCGTYYKHVGVDLMASAGREVTIEVNGTVRQVSKQNPWFWCVVVEAENRSRTFVVWHLDRVQVKVGQKVKPGMKLGVVADLDSKVSPDHIHLGKRMAPFHSSLSCKGALPACNHKPAGLPQFPEKFVPPSTSEIRIR